MNVNSGGPHILLFERDQQLTGLLTSEFQLAGYECHAARTAVEVFDAIARFPIRLVLVNLAQAAASRREFWVALDAQRRGRGVQVFTFRCMNLAGYGADDPDDRSRSVLTDMEVDGMLGVMNLVDAVRARIPGSTTGSFPRMNAASAVTGQEGASRLNRQAEGDARSGVGQVAQTTVPMSTLTAPSPSGATAAPTGVPEQNGPARTGVPAPAFTDKIRAVIYPSNRSYASPPETNWSPHSAPAQRPVSGADAAVRPQVAPNTGDVNAGAPPVSPGQRMPLPADAASSMASSREESSLAQLSRMVRENTPVRPEEVSSTNPRIVAQPVAQSASTPTAPPAPQQEQQRATPGTRIAADDRAERVPAQQMQQARPVESTSISDLPLRASPIEDLPIERPLERRSGQTGQMGKIGQAGQIAQTGALSTQAPEAVSTAMPAASVKTLTVSAPTAKETPAPLETPAQASREIKAQEGSQSQESIETEQDEVIERVLVDQSSALSQALRRHSDHQVTSEDVLLNIVQSLPPMSSLPTPLKSPPQTPVLSGRATRSLGSVLLEGHLVPQHRLEVAQNIQRMLRGVDMNYQLGEILLMFKLLTPDQLLAASLVSYGLISATQISALGRIRQELHAINLEYDLESLLVLFRILTPDQLREVRASWSG